MYKYSTLVATYILAVVVLVNYDLLLPSTILFIFFILLKY